MNAQTSLYCPSTRAVIATACVAFSAVAPLAAFADAPTAPATHTLESKVSLADLDLSTAKGVRAAAGRSSQQGACRLDAGRRIVRTSGIRARPADSG